MSNVSNLVMWSLIVGFVTPPVLAVIQQPRFSRRVQSILAFAFSAVLALGLLYFDETLGFRAELDAENFISALLMIFVTATNTYRNLWKPTGIAPAIESVTTVGEGDLSNGA